LHDAALDDMEHAMTPGAGASNVVDLVGIQGGYAPVPDQACTADQWFIAATTVLTMTVSHPGSLVPAYYARFEADARLWMSERAQGSTQSLREYLAEHVTDLQQR
jgi:hypothetical protein